MEEAKKKHLQSLLRHIKLVQDACQLLGERLIEAGEETLGVILIANGMAHDQSKFHGIEFDYLVKGEHEEEYLKLAIQQHWTANEHHAQYWGGINAMPRIYVAEMVCDWYARSIEFGTNLRDWIKTDAAKRYGMSTQGKAYKTIKQFVDLILEEPFKSVPVDGVSKSKKAGGKNGKDSNGDST